MGGMLIGIPFFIVKIEKMAHKGDQLHVWNEKFSMLISSVQLMEKEHEKVYRRIVKSAFTDELSKCLSPVSTDYVQHIQRLKLIGKRTKYKGTQSPMPKKEKVSFKKPDFVQDLEMIEMTLKYQHRKLAIYEFLHPLAVNLELETAAEIIAQTLEDHRNTNKWLRQIAQNIILPSLSANARDVKNVPK